MFKIILNNRIDLLSHIVVINIELWHCDVEPGAGTNRAYGVDTAGL